MDLKNIDYYGSDDPLKILMILPKILQTPDYGSVDTTKNLFKNPRVCP